jgi:hypothetical protein
LLAALLVGSYRLGSIDLGRRSLARFGAGLQGGVWR